MILEPFTDLGERVGGTVDPEVEHLRGSRWG
jgi:hypothetical protein